MKMNRIFALLTVSALNSAALLASSAQAVTFTIGYQKGGLPALLKARGTLDQARAQGIDFQWALFTAGPPLLEAANAGAVDFGAVGDAPGVFALAGGADLKYVATSEGRNPTTEAIIVPGTSAIRTLKDLKGKRVGVARGSSAHYFLSRALASAGLTLKDVTLVPLLPPDARPAFETGSIDAWAIWDPFLTTALQGSTARVLQDHSGLYLGKSFYLAPTRVVNDAAKKKALQYLLDALAETAAWANTHQAAVIDELHADLGLPLSVLNVTVPKGLPYNIRPFRAGDTQGLQGLADAFYAEGVLPKAVKLSTATYVSLPTFIGSRLQK